MLIRCEQCSTTWVLEDERVPPGGAVVQCTQCNHVFTAVRRLDLPDPSRPAEESYRSAEGRQVFGAPKPNATPPRSRRLYFGAPPPLAKHLQLVVTDSRGQLVLRTTLVPGASRTQIPLMFAKTCAPLSRFTVTLTHPDQPEVSIALQALSDPGGWIELQPPSYASQPLLDRVWQVLD